MATTGPAAIAPETVVHRVGGAGVTNLRLSPMDRQESPPGISVLLGGTPQEAAEQMRQAFPGSRKWRRTGGTVASITVESLRRAGFEVIPDATSRFPNHARLIHPAEVAGFTDANLAVLAQEFVETTGC